MGSVQKRQIHTYLKEPKSWEYTPDWGSPIALEKFIIAENSGNYEAVFVIDFMFRDKFSTAQVEISKYEGGHWQAQLNINGTYQTWQDPHSYQKGTHTTSIDNWVAWIFAVDGESRRDQALQNYESSQQWGSNTIEGMLARVDLGIASYGRLSTNAANFNNAVEFRNWLNENSPNPNAEFTVHALEKPLEYAEIPWEHRHYIIHRGTKDQTEPKILYSVALATPTPDNAHGMAAVSQGWVMSTSLAIALDGTEIVAHDSLDVLSLPYLQPYLNDKTSGNWYVIAIKGLELAILCPAKGACIDLDWDHDGSSISVTVTDEDRVVVDNIATARHRKTWSKWYDTSAELAPAELNAGIIQAENALFSLMAEEDAVIAKETADE